VQTNPYGIGVVMGATRWGWVIRTDEQPNGECYYHLVSMPAAKLKETPQMRVEPESAA